MNYEQYGAEHPQVILLLHGGGLGPWHHRQAALLLQDRYRVVLPVLDGHAGSRADFDSVEENARHLLDWVDREFGGQLFALGGTSLGAQVALAMLALRPKLCRYALIESGLVKPMRLTCAIIPFAFGMSYGLIRMRWFSKLQAAYLGIPNAFFEAYYRDTCAITRENMIAFLRGNCAFVPPEGLSQTQARVRIAVGSRELPAMKASAKLLQGSISGSDCRVLTGFSHGQLSLKHPQEFIRLLLEE